MNLSHPPERVLLRFPSKEVADIFLDIFLAKTGHELFESCRNAGIEVTCNYSKALSTMGYEPMMGTRIVDVLKNTK